MFDLHNLMSQCIAEFLESTSKIMYDFCKLRTTLLSLDLLCLHKAHSVQVKRRALQVESTHKQTLFWFGSAIFMWQMGRWKGTAELHLNKNKGF